MEKTAGTQDLSTPTDIPIAVSNAIPEVLSLEGCQGCMALTATICDLGHKTKLTRTPGQRQVARPLTTCKRPEDGEEYLIEHLKRM